MIRSRSGRLWQCCRKCKRKRPRRDWSKMVSRGKWMIGSLRVAGGKGMIDERIGLLDLAS